MQFSIRKATPDDAKTLADLIVELATYEQLMDEAEPSAHRLREHLQEDAQPRCEALLAETDDGTAVGFALFYRHYSTFLTNFGLYLEDLFVRPTYRGEGIGFALLQQVATIAEERNCRRLDWAVLDWNEPAIDFYHEIGAESMTDWTMMRLDEDQIEEVARAESIGEVSVQADDASGDSAAGPSRNRPGPAASPDAFTNGEA
jgi:diamine N-acetyltransferase